MSLQSTRTEITKYYKEEVFEYAICLLYSIHFLKNDNDQIMTKITCVTDEN